MGPIWELYSVRTFADRSWSRGWRWGFIWGLSFGLVVEILRRYNGA